MRQSTSTESGAAGNRRAFRRAAAVVAAAIALTTGALVLGGAPQDDSSGGPRRPLAGAGPAGVPALQAHLKAQPKDHAAWAGLAAAYIEQARTTGDPSRYPEAERALDRSLRLRPGGGNDAALAGRAALAAARHDFPAALSAARRALAVNPYSERALATRVDALVELGRYDAAMRAAKTADLRRPGVPVFTRYAYVLELRGDVTGARRVLTRAADSARAPGDIAYVATQLGQLAWSQGQYATARRHYATALRAEPGSIAALSGRARTLAATGDTNAAIRDLRTVVQKAPLPSELALLGELYEATGRDRAAREQYRLIDDWAALARAAGVSADLDTAVAAADHGDPAVALRAARAEWQRRQTVHTADALAWALHANGRDREALRYARVATAQGYRWAPFMYHRAVIEGSQGMRKPLAAHLRQALEWNPAFSVTDAPRARKTLEGLR
ncbi:tetratricopeptide repeat protein [Streptomyces sp. A7024]|uniref:Tetratricopeptide repeat protein n=1 Tax=Streptomyces coryli TaxID=1128680 RepID=A0A6G4U923_9ACTN|nr:tetratricopeptide repeat protein [Streptomyces coryli]NGN68729.1 tetratricopeptide repeat protein [Streptomyces coryli]